MGKVGESKNPKGIVIYCFVTIKCCTNPRTTICTVCCLLLSCSHRSLLWVYDSQTHSSDLWLQDNSRLL